MTLKKGLTFLDQSLFCFYTKLEAECDVIIIDFIFDEIGIR